MNHFKIIEEEGLINSDSSSANAIALPSIKNVKYLITLENKKVFYSGLRMLSARSLKARAARIVLNLCYRFGLIKHIFKPNLVSLNKESSLYILIKEHYEQSLGVNLYFGRAKNFNFSLTIQVIDHQKEFYIRYPLSSLSKLCAANEYMNLTNLYQKGLGHFLQKIDKVIDYKNDKIYSYEGILSYTTKTQLCKNKIKLLREMTFSHFNQLKENAFFKNSNLMIETMLRNPDYLFCDSLNAIYKETINIISSIFIQTAFFHGDFSPDNILISSGNFYLIDLEYSDENFFSCFDLFHYLYKAKKLHLRIITINDLTLINDYVNETYGKYPFYAHEKQNELMLLKSLFIFYLFLLLKRYVLDEQLPIDSDILKKLQQSIKFISSLTGF